MAKQMEKGCMLCYRTKNVCEYPAKMSCIDKCQVAKNFFSLEVIKPAHALGSEGSPRVNLQHVRACLGSRSSVCSM